MKLQTSISPKYVENWDISKAIRELIQNYLDSRQEFKCDGYLTWKDGQGIAKDYGPGLEMRHLAMGISEKSTDAKGKYGEGLKLALLVFAREERPLEIWANGKIIKPLIEYSPEYETDLLVLEVDDLPPHFAATHKGTSIKFDCSEAEFTEGKSYFIDFTKRDERFKWLETGKISLPGGYLYVNGTRVGELKNSLFSYHLDEREVGDIGNRDREVIDMVKAANAVGRMVAETSSIEALTKILESLPKNESWESENIHIYHWQVYKRANWTRAANQAFGGAVIATGNTTIDSNAAYQGHTLAPSMPYKWVELLVGVEAMKTTAQVLSESKTSQKGVARKDLLPHERENLRKAEALVKEHYTQAKLKIHISEALAVTTKTNVQKVQGLYDSKTGRIYLDREVLGTLKDALSTLLHETVHMVSGFADCTAEFENALLQVSVGMMLKGLA